MFFFALLTGSDGDTPTKSDFEAQTVKKAASGDTRAFETLVRKYESFVCTACFAVLHNREDAFDASQETFLKAWRRLDSFKGECAFSSWLYRIAKNTSLDMLRAKKHTDAFSLTDEDDEVIDVPDTSDSTNPEQALLTAEKREKLHDALNRLSDDHKTVIRLRDIEGYGYAAIAEMLHIEEGTVKSRLYRARAALRDILSENDYF